MSKYNYIRLPKGYAAVWLPNGTIMPVMAGGKKGGGTVNVPGPDPKLTQAQINQLNQQTAMVEQMRREQQLIAPMMYRQYGYNPQFSPTGELIGLSQTPEAAERLRLGEQISGAYQKRQLAALHGELPIDPGLMIDLARQEEEHKASLASQFGQGGQSSTGALQSQDIFNARKMAILEGARRGDLTLAEQLGAAEQTRQTELLQRQSGAAGIMPQLTMQNLGASSIPGQTISTWQQGDVAGRQMGLNAAMFNAQRRSSAFGGLGGIVGAVGGAALGSYFGSPMAGAQLGMSAGGSLGQLFSDRRLKSNIVKIGTFPITKSLNVYVYTKFGRPEIGVMADEVEKVKPEAVTIHPSGFKLVNYSKL